MNAVKDKLIALVGEELEAANAIYPPFASMHEGYAVLKEEVEEAKREQERAEYNLHQLWLFVRHDQPRDAKQYATKIKAQAMQLAAEAIQVAAMAEKFLAIGKDINVHSKEEKKCENTIRE